MMRQPIVAIILCILAPWARAESLPLGLEQAAYDAWRQAQVAWDPAGFTDPAKHKDDQFKYIVHAGPNVLKGGGKPIPAFMERILTLDFNQMPWFSASLISQQHTATFSLTGVILGVPAEKVLSATPDDMRSCLSGATGEQLQARMRGLLDMYGLKGPDQILARAKGGAGFFRFDLSWTEVLVFGTAPAPLPIRIRALFVHRDSTGRILLEDSDLKVVRETAEKMHLPLIQLPPPKDCYVLRIQAKGHREPKEWSITSFGPKEVAFAADEATVKRILAEAKAHSARVTLVDIPDREPSYEADPDYLGGVCWDRDGQKPIAPAQLPAGIGPVTFTFGAEQKP
jgi:hypothetical protein